MFSILGQRIDPTCIPSLAARIGATNVVANEAHMSVTEVHAAPRWKSVALWAVKIILAIAFFSAGAAKLYGVPMMVETFQTIGLGQWFRYLTGALEVIGAILILMPVWSV